VGLYFFSSLVGVILTPEGYNIQELYAGLSLAAGAAFIIWMNGRTRTPFGAKLMAYLFTTFILTLLFKLGTVYENQADIMSSIFVFTLFLVCITIPWTPRETIAVGGMHVGAYTLYYLYIQRFMPDIASGILDLGEYLDGMLFLVMAVFLCFVVRRRDHLRDIKDFVLLKEIESKNRQMQKELEFAKRIHKTLVPNSISSEKVDIEVSYLPVYYVGGDYAKFHFLDKDRLIFIISDVTGHGVSAALLVNRLHSEFERLAKEGNEPGILLSKLDDFIKEDFEGTDMYLSAFCGLLDFHKMRMSYSNHGHPPQCLYHLRGAFVEDLPAQMAMLGLPIDNVGVSQDEVKFGEGDRILLFTDGVIETTDKSGSEYGKEKLEAFLRENHDVPPHIFNQELIDDLKTFSGSQKFKDDVFILHMAVKASHGIFG
jgi:sigma-B regulation protein RsbU (phosphoserine phosphatase)